MYTLPDSIKSSVVAKKNFDYNTIYTVSIKKTLASRAIDLADDIGYYVPHFNLAERIFQSQQPVYLYQFEYRYQFYHHFQVELFYH